MALHLKITFQIVDRLGHKGTSNHKSKDTQNELYGTPERRLE
jgi:hypothetical protein